MFAASFTCDTCLQCDRPVSVHLNLHALLETLIDVVLAMHLARRRQRSGFSLRAVLEMEI
jgi:hypothetical protein